MSEPRLHLLVEVSNLPQLRKIEPQVATDCVEAIHAATADFALTEHDYGALVTAPATQPAVAALVDAARNIHRSLAGRADDLHGYSSIVATAGQDDVQLVIGDLSQRLYSTHENGIWCDASAVELVSAVAALTRVGEFWQIGASRDAGAEAGDFADWFWVRESVLDRMLDALELRLNHGRPPWGIAVASDDRAATGRYLTLAAERLVGVDNLERVPRMGALYRRRSPSHPFVGCVRQADLSEVPRWLDAADSLVWQSTGHVLAHAAQGAHPGLRPDRALRDILSAAHLVLLSHVRAMAAAGLPGVILCHDADRYHPTAVTALANMLHDVAQLPNTIVMMSVAAAVPAGLRELDIRRIVVRPISRAAAKQLVAARYPGAVVPERPLRQIMRLSAGRLRAVQLYLDHLAAQGKLRRAGESWSWVTKRQTRIERTAGEGAADADTVLPASVAAVAWQRALALDPEDRELLYLINLAGGLLVGTQIQRCLHELGIDGEQFRRSLARLRAVGLVDEVPTLHASFPQLRARLATALADGGGELRAHLCRFAMQLWRTSELHGHVQLYALLLRCGAAVDSAVVLRAALTAKLDEGGSGATLGMVGDEQVARLLEQLAVGDRQRLEVGLAAARIRAHTLRAEYDAAEEAARTGATAVAPLELGELHLQSARMWLARGDANAALNAAKQALAAHQEAHHPGGEALAFLELAASLLATGKLDEARGYLALLPASALREDRPLAIRAAALQVVIRFLDAQLAGILGATAAGIEQSAASGRREWQLYFSLVDARAYFALGLYAEAQSRLQTGLALAEVYGFRAEAAVFWRWLGRCCAYRGAYAHAVRLLASDGAGSGPGVDATVERLLFLAEAHHFAGDGRRARAAAARSVAVAAGQLEPAATAGSGAVAAAERSAAHPDQPVPDSGRRRFPAERPAWASGFLAVEGFCHELGSALLARYSRAFDAYLTGIDRGAQPERAAAAAATLNQITRSEDLRLDLHAATYHLMYARVASAPQQDGNAAPAAILGRGIGYLRDRAAGIRAPYERECYTGRDRWHASLMAEARRLRLL